MTELHFYVVIFLIISIDFIISYFVLKKNQDKITMKTEVKERVLQLFLFAEKLDIVGIDKMNYVANKIEDHVPGRVLEYVLNGRDLVDFLQEVYDEIFSRIKH